MFTIVWKRKTILTNRIMAMVQRTSRRLLEEDFTHPLFSSENPPFIDLNKLRVRTFYARLNLKKTKPFRTCWCGVRSEGVKVVSEEIIDPF